MAFLLSSSSYYVLVSLLMTIPLHSVIAYCDWGPDGTGSSASCQINHGAGGEWCNTNAENCVECSGKWCDDDNPVTVEGYCDWGTDGTGQTAKCTENHGAGGEWCNAQESNCAECSGKWCTAQDEGGEGGGESDGGSSTVPSGMFEASLTTYDSGGTEYFACTRQNRDYIDQTGVVVAYYDEKWAVDDSTTLERFQKNFCGKWVRLYHPQTGVDVTTVIDDTCGNQDCNGCCRFSANHHANGTPNGLGKLIDMETRSARRLFGPDFIKWAGHGTIWVQFVEPPQ